MTLQNFPENGDLISDWCAFHHSVNRISEQRQRRQLHALREFEQSMTRPVVEVDAPDLQRFIAALTDRGYHPHTIVWTLRMVRPFIRYLREQGMIDAERWLRLQAVKEPRGAYDGQPRPYNAQQLRRFWVELDERYPWTRDKREDLRTPARGEYWVRRWAAGSSDWKRVFPYARRLQVEAVVALALYGGMRRGEIYTAALSDLDYEAEYVPVRSRKGPDGHEKLRIVPITKPMRLAIGNWVEFRAQVLSPEHEHPWLCLWASRALEPMSFRQFGGLLEDVGRGWELHRLRHTFGTMRYRSGMPIEILQPIMGHARITQTLGYTKISEDQLIDATRASDKDFLRSVNPDSNQEVA